MKGRIVKDWAKVDVSSPKGRAKLLGAMNHFMGQPDKADSMERKLLNHFATKGDFPAEVLQVLEKVHQVPDYDLGYEQFFDIRDFTGTNESGFRLVDVTSGLTFKKHKGLGDKIDINKVSGSETSVNFDLYGGAIGWLRTLIDDKQYWALEDNSIAFRNKWFADRATNFYALLEAAGALNTQAWAAVTPAGVPTTNENYNAIRDANTINAAALGILTDVKDKGYGVNANTELVLLAPLALKSRITQALAIINQPVVGSPNKVSFNIRPVYSLMLTSTSKYFVGLPGKKIKGGYRMDLTTFGHFDDLAYTDVMAGWGRYGGAVGDTDQIKECATS